MTPYDETGRAAAEAVCERADQQEQLVSELATLLGEMVMALDVVRRLATPGAPAEWEPPQRRALRVAFEHHGAAGVVALVKDWIATKPTREQLEHALSKYMAGERKELARS